MADQGVEGLLSPFLRSQRVKAARPYLKGRVLDFGCGSGVIADWVPPDQYLGVDVNGLSIERASRLHPQHRFQSTLPPVEPAFDTIICLAVIEHIQDPAACLRDLADRLGDAPENSIVCTTPHPAVGWVHTAGASIRFFSRHANDEHEELLNRVRLDALANDCGLILAVYRRFLLGANQLAVFQRNRDFL